MSTSHDDADFDRGIPGASARREHARRRANRHTRIRAKHPRLGGLQLAVQGEPQHEQAWARGAEGEERVARSLAKHLDAGVALLHDRAIPHSPANIDHIAVAPSGVWVIDSKHYTGKVAIRRPFFGRAKLTIAGRDQTKLIDGLAKQVARVEAGLADIARDVPVRGALCFVDAELPLLGKLTFKGYPLLYPRGLAKRVNAPGPVPPERVHAIAARLAERFPPR